jgi:hypothetical protein
MGFFSNKKNWQSLPAEDVADAINSMSPKDAQQAMKDIKAGKVPGLTPKQQKQIEKDYRKKTEGERGLGAGAAAAKDFFQGRQGKTVDPIKKGGAKSNKPLNKDGTTRSSWW